MPHQKTKYLFLFTIGPVKSFLRESRKTQDIFAGSELLSHLCKLAMDKAKVQFENENFEIITPNIKGKPKNLSIPNRFMAELETGDGQKTLKEKAEAIQQAIKDEFEKIPGIKDKDLPIGALEQLKAHLEIHWLFHKIDSDYKEAFTTINNNLAAIKNHTPFNGHPERGRKCIVDGRRNVKFYRETKDNEITKFPNSKILKKLYQKETEVKVLSPESDTLPIWQLQKGEGISAVTLRKRLYENEPHTFPSTAAVALMHIFEECEDNEKFKTFKINVQGEGKEGNSFKREPLWLKHSDDQLFFKDNIERILTNEKQQEKINEVNKAHEAWSKNLKIPLTSYYALIRFDGDKMGDWFSGDKKKPEIDLKDFQQALSAAIIDFADTLQSEVEMKKYWGKVVYAGGEDFMAFVNLHKLAKAVNCVRTLFDEKINGNAKLKEMVKDETVATLSMGICIAHYKEPLQMVLDKAAAAEKLAKDNNRKSFAITISKHSGGQINNAISWKKDNSDLWKNFHAIISAIRKTNSGAFLRKLYDYLETYQFFENTEKTKAKTEAEKAEIETIKKIINSKIKLYVKRSKSPDATSKDIEDLIEQLKSLHQGTIANFAETLLVLDFLQRKAKNYG